VHVLLLQGQQVLLTQRRDTNPAFDGRWHLSSGKLDADESVLHAATREANEEVGVQIESDDLSCVHTLHVANSGPEPPPRTVLRHQPMAREPSNQEPDKYADLAWFDLDNLPDTPSPTPPPAYAATATACHSASWAGPDRPYWHPSERPVLTTLQTQTSLAGNRPTPTTVRRRLSPEPVRRRDKSETFIRAVYGKMLVHFVLGDPISSDFSCRIFCQ
jgi:8-oxo-dGTP pyrophosphatase MutT (NUDIX family)